MTETRKECTKLCDVEEGAEPSRLNDIKYFIVPIPSVLAILHVEFRW